MKKILIVDDEQPLAHALDLKFTHAGFTTKTAGDGEEALALIEAEQFDIILLDMVMPKMDGFTVLAKLKEKNVAAKIIVTSNLSQPEDITRAKSLGALDYLIKSDSPLSDIVERVNQLTS